MKLRRLGEAIAFPVKRDARAVIVLRWLRPRRSSSTLHVTSANGAIESWGADTSFVNLCERSNLYTFLDDLFACARDLFLSAKSVQLSQGAIFWTNAALRSARS